MAPAGGGTVRGRAVPLTSTALLMSSTAALAGLRVAFVGRLAGMSRRDAQALAREHGATPVERIDGDVQVVVVGEAELPMVDLDEVLDADARAAFDQGLLLVVTETQLWQRLGLVDGEHNVHRLYTPAMLADLAGVPLAVIRRWQRRGLIRPIREVRRLPYFDFQEVATARRLAELLSAGVSPQAMEKKLAALGRWLPEVARPLAQLSVMIEGKQLLLRQGDGLIDSAGQMRLNFDAEPATADDEHARGVAALDDAEPPATLRFETPLEPAPGAAASPEELAAAAADLEDAGRLAEAADTYRAALAAGGPDPVICFALAEALYRLGDAGAARERYWMAIELDEHYVEARANLGCVLAEEGRGELAIAAFTGALAAHPDYADAHFHLARTLDDLDRSPEAEVHWRRFLDLAPTSPWAETARRRLGETQ